jgi:hypothetical protein
VLGRTTANWRRPKVAPSVSFSLRPLQRTEGIIRAWRHVGVSMDEFSRARQVGGGDGHMLERTWVAPEIWRGTIGLTTAQALLSRANSRRRLPRIAALSCQDFTVRSQTGTSIMPKGPAANRRPGPLTCCFSGVSEGIRTPDTQDHNNVAEGERPRKTPVSRDF